MKLKIIASISGSLQAILLIICIVQADQYLSYVNNEELHLFL